MPVETVSPRRARILLAGDGFIFTAATFAIALAIQFGLFVLAGSPGSNVFWALTNIALMAAGEVGGIVAAWLLHGHRITRIAVIGALFGGILTGLLTPAIMIIAYLLGLIASIFTAWEFAGPLAGAVLFVTAFVALLLWLLIDAVRDLAFLRRNHVRIDIARIVSAAVLVIFAVTVAIIAIREPGTEMSEAIIFALLAGATGALAITGANIAVEREKAATRRNRIG